MTADITLICETCSFPISRDMGCIYIRTFDVGAYYQAQREWREAHPDGEAVDLRELLEHPDGIHWRTGHDACRTDRDEPTYEISDHQIASWAQLMSWTAHLMSKNWFDLSDWDDLLREVSGEIPAVRIRVAAKEAA